MDVTLSHFLRRSGEVLADVDDDDVVLRRRDGDDLVLTTSARSRARADVLGLLGLFTLEATRSTDDAGVLERALAAAAPWTAALTSQERSRVLRDVGRAASTAAELGTTEPLTRALDRWRRTARTRAAARPLPTYMTRPVSIPDDIDDRSVEKATGVVELPLRVRWSGPSRTYDLDDPRQLRRVYEQVLREGTDDDVRYFVDLDTLIENWSELVLPQPIRRAWADWLRRRRGLELAC